PDVDQVLTTFGICNQTLVVGSLDLGGLLLVRSQDGCLIHVRGDVRDRHGDTRAGRPVETGVLQVIQGGCGNDLRVALCQIVDDLRECILASYGGYPRVVRRQGVIEQHLAKRGIQQCRGTWLPALRGRLVCGRNKVLHADLDRCVQVQLSQILGHDGLGNGCEHATGANFVGTLGGQVVQTDDHILRRLCHWAAIGRLQDIVRGQHQDACFSLCFWAQRQVYCHLVTVEVSVERATHQWVQL